MSAPRSGQLPTLRQILAAAHLRLILLAVALAAVSLVVSGTLVIRGYVQRNLVLTAQTINYTIEPALVFNDKEAIQTGISSIADKESVARVEVVTPDGKLIAVWNKPHGDWNSNFETITNSFFWPSPSIIEVRRSNELLATIRVHGSAEAILNYALSGLIIALACLGLTIVATRILARRLQDDVIGPLERVAEVAHSVRQERAFSRRLPAAEIDEVDRFTRDFNALLEELEGWHQGFTNENAELTHRATHDVLTNLGNRTLFDHQLQKSIASSDRSGKPFAVIYLDADGFKNINDQHGHEVGDLALKEVASRLLNSIRSGDNAFRLGGDEFALIIDPLSEDRLLDVVIERIETAMGHPFFTPNQTKVQLSMSIGHAVFPDHDTSSQALLRRADAEMYRDKNNKKNPTENEAKSA